MLHHARRGPFVACRRQLLRFLLEERGEIAPASYLITLMTALMMMFFALDLGVQKGARLAVEYAAFCAARAAATQLPSPDGSGCQSADDAVRHAAAACLASVVSKRGSGQLTSAGAIAALIRSAESRVTVRLSGANGSGAPSCSHNEIITAEVTYRHALMIPFSPLSTSSGTVMTARAQAMLQTIK